MTMKNKVVSAQLRWRLPEEGGRNTLPSNTRYLTVGRYYDSEGRQIEGEWSTIVESDSPLNQSRTLIASLSLLLPDNAPDTILDTGNRFELTEGFKIVATGEILILRNSVNNQQLQYETPVLISVG